MDSTGDDIYIVEDGSNRLVAYCTSGSTCTTSDEPHVATSTVTYTAEIAPDGYTSSAPPSGSVVASGDATAPGWAVSLNATLTPSGYGTGVDAYLTATWNYPMGFTPDLWVYFVEQSSGRLLAYCQTGTICAIHVAPHAAGPASYVAEVATSGYTTAATPPPSSAVFGVSAAVSAPAWAIHLQGVWTAGGGWYPQAITNYNAGQNSYYVTIWDLTNNTYVYCNGGAGCSGVSYYGQFGDTFVAFVQSSLGWPSPPIAVSNILNAPTGGEANQSDGGGSRSRNDAECACKDPVNPRDGEFYESAAGLAMATAGPALAIAPTYSSDQATFDGPLGFGWSSLLNTTLTGTASPASQVTVRQENGAQLTFTLSGSTYLAPPGDFATLVHNGGGTWTFTRRSREIFTFDASGQLLSTSDLNGETVTAADDSSGRIGQLTYGDRTITIGYGTNGRVASLSDSAGRSVTYGYNSAGDLTSATDAAGATTTYGYDVYNHLTTVAKPGGGVVTNVYGTEGRVASQADPLGTTTFGYSGNVTTVTSPLGHVTRLTYTSGQLTTKTDGYGTAAAATWTYTYDPTTQSVASITDPRSHTTSYTYDSAGNTLTETDNAGKTWIWTYNAFDEPLTATNPDSVTVTSTYNGSGNLTSTSTPIDATHTAAVSYAHTISGHPGLVSSMTDANSHTTTFGYDSDGDLTSVTDPDGDQTTYTYTGEGWKASSTSPRGNASASPSLYTTAYTYDGDGRVATVTAPGRNPTSYTYDGDGNTLTVTDPKSNVTTNTYNTADELTVEHRPDTSTIHYGYDADGNQTSVADPGSHVTSYTYDALDRMISQTTPATAASPSGITTTYTLDGNGNATAIAQPGTGGITLTTTNGYDADNRPTSISYSDGTTHAVTYTYTPEGQRATMIDATGTSHYTYNLAGWLTSTTDGAGHTVGYSYDLAGNETSIGYPNGHSVTRGFNAEEKLSSVTDWNSKTTSFGYDRDGDLATIGYPNGVTETTSFDKADVSSVIADTTSSATLASSTLTRDANDELTGVATSGTSIGASTSYGYNSLGQLTTYQYGTGSPAHYTFDSDDNLTYSPVGTTQTFDAAHEMTHTGTATGTFDTRGNLLAQVPTSGAAAYYSYDQANRITYAYVAGVLANYLYNGDGLRTSKTVGTTTSTFTWDTTADTPLLLSDGSTSYLYGPGDQPVEQISTTATTYLQHDQQGSTTLLTNGTGTVVGKYTYIPYGPVIAYTGTVSTQLLFDGEYFDNETGLYYLRARYYNPTTSQFLTRDPIETATAQPYEYADDDPIDMEDPSGLCWTHVACSTVNAVDNKLSSGASWVENHKADTAGLVLGAAAAATGVGAVVEGATFLGLGLSATSLGAGAAAAGLDANRCFGGDTVACVGFGLGGAGAGAGVFPVVGTSLILSGAIQEGALSDALLNYLPIGFGLNFGLAGLTLDFASLSFGSRCQ